jgi:hypothetical protein
LEEALAKNCEYQRSRQARLKAEAVASKLIASSQTTAIHDLNLQRDEIDSRMDGKGSSCKWRRDMTSEVDNIGILLWFLLSTFGFFSSLSLLIIFYSF